MEFSVMCGLINNPRFNAMIKRFEQKYPSEDKFKVVWDKFENIIFNKSFAESFILAIGKNNLDDKFFKKANKNLLLNNYGTFLKDTYQSNNVSRIQIQNIIEKKI